VSWTSLKIPESDLHMAVYILCLDRVMLRDNLETWTFRACLFCELESGFYRRRCGDADAKASALALFNFSAFIYLY